MKRFRVLRLRQWTALVMDVFYLTAGVLAVIFPSRAIEVSIPWWGVLVWGSFYIIGGLLSAIGVVLKQDAWRFVGLPLMISASTMYGLAVVLQYRAFHDGAFLFVGTLLLATAVGLFDRWNVISAGLRTLERREKE